MQEQDGIRPGHRELELALKSVVPAVARVDPVAAAFAAGRRSARPRVHFWQAAAVLALAIGIGSRFIPAGREAIFDPSSVGPGLAIRHTPPAAEPISDQSLLMLQRAVQKNGLDGLPRAHVGRAKVIHTGDVL